MAFMKFDKKASGTYLRLVDSYRETKGSSKHKTI